MPRFTKNQALVDHIGARLKRERDAQGLSQRELARRVYGGLADGTITKYEKGEHGPSIESLCLLALALGLEPADMLPTREELQALFPS